MAGVDIRTVQLLMGHKTLAMTMRCAHVSQGHQLEAVQRIARRIETPSGTTSGTEVPVAGGDGAQALDIPDAVEWAVLGSNQRPPGL